MKPSRRQLLKLGGGVSPLLILRDRTYAQQKTLKIAKWRHFVPAYDEWFETVYVKAWGQQHDTKVSVDYIPMDRIQAAASGEITAGKGHDIFLFPWPPATYHQHVIDHSEIYQGVAGRHGNLNSLAHLSTFNPKTKRYFAFADSWIPAPVHYLADYWREINTPFGPSNYETLRAGAKKIRGQHGIPCGLALAPGLESNITLHTLLWAFRTSVQDEDGNVTINSSQQTIKALKYVKALYEEAGTPESLSWGPAGNARAMLARKTSCTVNAISLVRAAERDNPELAKNIMLRPPMAGPGGILSAPHVTNCYAIWKFAENQEGAKQFLVDLADNSKSVYEKSESCNFPLYQNTVPDLIARLGNDSKADPSFKYVELKDGLHWTRNLGYPGFATPGAMEVFERGTVQKMFASVIKGDLSPEDAASTSEKEVKRIFEKWGAA